LNVLDSRFCGNDKNGKITPFYETILITFHEKFQTKFFNLFDIIICLIYIELDFVKNLSERRMEGCTGLHIKGRWPRIRCVTLE
jgi:hypothetical protein